MKIKSLPLGTFSRNFYIIAVLVAVTFVGALWVVNLMFSGLQSKEATLLLDFENDGKGRMFTGEVVDGMTVLDVLVVSSEAGNIELIYTIDAEGKTIISGINGHGADSIDKRIVFYLDQKRIETELINSIIIKPGDNIEVRLE